MGSIGYSGGMKTQTRIQTILASTHRLLCSIDSKMSKFIGLEIAYTRTANAPSVRRSIVNDSLTYALLGRGFRSISPKKLKDTMYSASHIRAISAPLSCLRHSLTRAALACAVVVVMAASGYQLHAATTSSFALVHTPVKSGTAAMYPVILAAQEKGDFAAANVLIDQLADTTLVGYVLAQRYQQPNYKATAKELTGWLTQYRDHPQASAILDMAARVGVKSEILAHFNVPKEAPLRGEGYAAQLGRSTMPDGWYAGLRLWREGNYWKAIVPFTAIARNEKLSPWQRSAGAYWSYRSFQKIGNTWEAVRSLNVAASFPETFYGMLANAQRGRMPNVTASLPNVTAALWNDGAVKRAQMLVMLGRNADAEAELRNRYSTLSANERPALVTIAATLNLPNLQLRLAQLPTLSASEATAARFPMPSLMIEAQNKVDPALILAVARHESAFRETVRNSGSGATGMMQMLPSTAQHVLKTTDDISLVLADNGNDGTMSIHERLNNMTMSAKLGGEYFALLAQQPAVGNDVIRLLAAYNAGPGTVANWQKAAKNIDDPLLYVELIPYPETHNYVVQVMAHYWVYQTLMGEHPNSLAQLARGTWPTL